MPHDMSRSIFGCDNCTVKRWYWLRVVAALLPLTSVSPLCNYQGCVWKYTSVNTSSCFVFSLRCLIQKQQSCSATIRWKSNRAFPKKGKSEESVKIIHVVKSEITFRLILILIFRWVEEDPKEILQSVYECMERTCEKLTQLNIDVSNIKGIHTFCSSWVVRC